ncbi:MAG: hypothetical protein AABY85_00555 [Gemmatimonadota bacterium]
MIARSLGASALVTAAVAASVAAPARPQATVLPAEQQIASAVLPAPADLQAGATVWGYSADGRLVKLRDGTSHMVCLADNPREERFHVACYHDSLEPFMARGRELRAQGLAQPAVDSARFADITAGRIRMPSLGSLYSMTGQSDSYDPATNTIRGARSLFVVYVPFATAASTGLQTTPARGTPWLMDPGSPKAHLMFTPTMQ